MMTFLTREVVDNAFISLPESRRSDIREIISTLDEMGIHSFLMLDSLVVNNNESRVEMLGDQQVIRFAPRIKKASSSPNVVWISWAVWWAASSVS